jgi:hypothetical protein
VGEAGEEKERGRRWREAVRLARRDGGTEEQRNGWREEDMREGRGGMSDRGREGPKDGRTEG